ncbi:MAG: hypothetical protein ACKPKO_44405, partial [Candidatus Fonsibacter sp.]
KKKQGKAVLRQDLLESTQAEPAQFNIYGQRAASSEDQAPPGPPGPPLPSTHHLDLPTDAMVTDAEVPLGPTLVVPLDSGLTSGIVAEQQKRHRRYEQIRF